MPSPQDWNGRPPQAFVGSYRLENDMSGTPADAAGPGIDGSRWVARLVAVSEAAPD